MCAVLCGLDEFADIAEYGTNKSRFLRDAFGIEKTPSKSTFCRVLNIMDVDKVASVIIEIMRENAKEFGEIWHFMELKTNFRSSKPLTLASGKLRILHG
jgi:hypothetical protein